jgi:esterase/lipase superfamily enzyme
MVIKKTTTTSGATGCGENDGSGGTKGSGAFRGLYKASNVIGTSFGTTGTAAVVIHPPLIAKIISLCGIPEDSTMVIFIFKKKWKELFDADFDDSNAFHMVKKYSKKVDICRFRCFLL